MDRPLTRRQLLVAGGAAFVLAACSSDDGGEGAAPASTDGAESGLPSTTTAAPDPSAPDAPGTEMAALTAADFEGLGTCGLVPEQTAGPFPLDEQLDRRDITEGYPGRPMRLGFRVIDAACAPVAGAAVEVWHADASGDYSAFADGGDGKDEGPGTTFLRGTQRAGDDGIVEFHTLYPGWYRGRAVHIHLRVHIDDRIVATSQVHFDEEYTAGVSRVAPYAEFGPPDTTNAADGIAGDPAVERTLLHLADGATIAGSGTVALLNLGVAP